jgi:glycosyltransferase involved in cell wall biosynthesis
LIKALVGQGYQVIAVAPDDRYSQRLRDLGCRFVGLSMDTHGTNPVQDLVLLLRYIRLFKVEQPHVYLGYTVKPNVYGSIAAQLLHIPVVNNIAGLGTAFVEHNFLTRVVRALYKCGLYGSERIFFQNAEDQDLFVSTGMVRSDITDQVPGSGIDLTRYVARPKPPSLDRRFRFLLVARLLRHKGIGEYVAAARIVRQWLPETEFELLGFIEEGNVNAISLKEIKLWESEKVIHYLGHTDDVRPYLANTDCVVLPSFYREGVPRTLLEAAAMARPIITTNAIGCRDAVDDGVNGLLCKERDVNDLVEKMIKMISLDPEQRSVMGKAGRLKVEEQFDENIVIKKYMDVIKDIVSDKARARTDGKVMLAGRGK